MHFSGGLNIFWVHFEESTLYVITSWSVCELWHCVIQAVDIFAAFSASAENRLTIMRELAKMWAVSDSVAEAFYPPNKPVIQVIVVSDHDFLSVELLYISSF